MRGSLKITLLTIVAMGLVQMQSRAFGQQDDAPAQRKILKKVMPTYPDLARRMSLHGVVKLEAIIAPNGNVRSTKVTGGNPVLAQAAVDAVSKWKFGIAPEESTQLIELRFDPR